MSLKQAARYIRDLGMLEDLVGKVSFVLPVALPAKTDINKAFEYVTCLTLSKCARIVVWCTLCLTTLRGRLHKVLVCALLRKGSALSLLFSLIT